MYYNVLKSIKYRKYMSLSFKNKWFLNILLKNHFFFYDIYKFHFLKSNISICKLRIRCFINGRSRSTSSKFRLSRFYFKEYSRKGLLNGIMKF